MNKINKELIEYYWNEITQCGEFVYEDLNNPDERDPLKYIVETKPQPLQVTEPTVETYWGELLWYLRTQGEIQCSR